MFKVIQKRNRRDFGTHILTVRATKKRELFLTGFMLFGLVLGVWFVRGGNGWADKVSAVWDNYLYVKADQTNLSGFFTSLCWKILPLLGVFMTGLCAVGTPFLYAFPVGYGFLFGFLGAYMYAKYLLKGIGYCALILYPGAAIMGAVMINACSISVGMCGTILKSLSPKGQAEEANIRSYSWAFLTMLAIAAAVSVLDVAVYRLFFRYFQFS